MAWIKAYKGFDKDMKCRGFQFEEGKEYEEQEAKDQTRYLVQAEGRGINGGRSK